MFVSMLILDINIIEKILLNGFLWKKGFIINYIGFIDLNLILNFLVM